MAYATCAAQDEGVYTQWTESAGTAVSCVTTDNDGNYIYSATDGYRHEFEFATPTLPDSNQMIMAIELVVVAKTTGVGSLKMVVRNGTTADDQGWDIPRNSSFTLTSTFTEYRLALPNKPGESIMGHNSAWDEGDTDVNDFRFGVKSNVTSGQVQVDHMRLDAVYRPKVTLDEILQDPRADMFQWMEIEGIRWVPTDRTRLMPGNWSVGAYYWGLDCRPVHGTLSTRANFRSGKINHGRGVEEYETGRAVLLDVDIVSHEGDANGGDPPLDHFVHDVEDR